jgi:P27 family predicted phage terminase small subunit
VRAKTAAEHNLTGTRSEVGRVRHDRQAAASQFVSGRPKFPKHLGKPARIEFKRICKFLGERKTLSEGDFYTIAVLAECTVRWIAAKEALGTNFIVTTTVKDKQGRETIVERENPLCKIVENCESKILSLSNVLGLNPASRDKVKKLQTGAELEEVVPGSMADLYPDICSGVKLEVVKPKPISPEEMTASDEVTE